MKKHAFVKESVREGVMPAIEKDLIQARAEIRAEMGRIKKKITLLEEKKKVLNDTKTFEFEVLLENYEKHLNGFIDKLNGVKSNDKPIQEKIDHYKSLIDILKFYNNEKIDDIDALIKDLSLIVDKSKIDYTILDKRQLATKISANSLYGWAAASTNTCSCVPVSETITSEGRKVIQKAKEYVEMTFKISNGYGFDTQVIYGDTDSIMIKMKYKNGEIPNIDKIMEDSVNMIDAVTVYVQALVKSTRLKMAWEKILFPMILCGKKKYISVKYEDSKAGVIDAKGVDTVRRETTEMTKDLINAMLNYILIQKDEEAAIKEVKMVIELLLKRKISIYKLISSKQLKAPELYKTKQVHTVLNDKIIKRGGEPYRPGDRVPFVILAGSNFKSRKINDKGKITSTKDKIRERGEDPLYAHQNKLKLDIDYYFENQIKKPIMRIFEDVIPNIEKLFVGEHVRHKVDITPKIYDLSKFVIKREKCLSCNSLIDIEDMCNEPLCKKCKKEEGKMEKIYKELEEKHSLILEKEKKSLKICYDCQRHEGDVLCSNVTACLNYWVREDISEEKKEIEKIMNRFYEIFEL